ncbi:MAG: SH3 domain-containing protein [Pseudomonadota bacterium]|nr:SH3 domain-containing protein [Pseudomonadota bacterium]
MSRIGERVLPVLAGLLLLAWTLPVVAASTDAAPADVGSETGLPLPRFVSVKSTTANLRAGPGTDYPIRWIYRRADMPVRIVDEHGNWRAVRDPFGGEGWLHSSLLSGRRTAMVMTDLAPVRHGPSSAEPVELYAERRVIAVLELCRDGWCRISLEGRVGWVAAADLFGSDPD